MTKKQVVKINGMYAPRIKKWYHLRWQYLGYNFTHTSQYNISLFCLCSTEKEAKDRLKWFLNGGEVVYDAT